MGGKHSGKRRNCLLRAISPFPTVFSEDLYCRHVKTRACLGKGKRQLKEFADTNFRFDHNGRKFFKWIENTVGKGEIAR